MTDESAPKEGEAPAGAQQPAGEVADEPKPLLPSPPVSSPTVDALSTPVQQNTTTQGPTPDPLPRILLIAALTLAIGIPYWLGVSSGRRCHRSGWLVYRRRREVVAWSLLPFVVVGVFSYLSDGFPRVQVAAFLLSPVVWLGLQ